MVKNRFFRQKVVQIFEKPKKTFGRNPVTELVATRNPVSTMVLQTERIGILSPAGWKILIIYTETVTKLPSNLLAVNIHAKKHSKVNGIEIKVSLEKNWSYLRVFAEIYIFLILVLENK